MIKAMIAISHIQEKKKKRIAPQLKLETEKLADSLS